MLSKFLIAWLLISLCVVVHVAGLTGILRWVLRCADDLSERFWPAAWFLIRIAGWIVLMHLIQIGIWACFYVWTQGMPDFDSALYFSAVTYTTTGYGDLVLPQEWRLIGACEALTGILMCGLSTGLFLAVVVRVFRVKLKTEH